MNASMPLASIIVNNYNYGRYLRQAIDSALSQTYRHIEVIVVDDGSTDDSRQVIAGYGDRVLPVLKENGGQASAFNAGFARSKGDLILFLDSDDVLLPDCIERAVRAIEECPEPVAKLHFRLQVVDRDLQNVDDFIPPMSQALPCGDLREMVRTHGRGYFPVTSGNVFTRQAMEKIMPIPPGIYRICADNYVCRLVPLFGHVLAIEEPLALWRRHGGNNNGTEGGALDERQLERELNNRVTLFHDNWKAYEHHRGWFNASVVTKFKAFHLITRAARQVVRRGLDQEGERESVLRLVMQVTPLLAGNRSIPPAKRSAAVLAAWLMAILPRRLALPLIRRACGTWL